MELKRALLRVPLLLSLILLPSTLLAEDASEYAHRGAQKYIFGDEQGAKAEVATGLSKFPNDRELKEMVKLFQDKNSSGGKGDKQQQQQQQQNNDSQNQQKNDQQSQNNNQNNNGGNGQQQKDQQQKKDDQSQAKNEHQLNNHDNSSPPPTPDQSPGPSPGQSPSPSPDSSKDDKKDGDKRDENAPPTPAPTPGDGQDETSPSPSPGEGDGEGDDQGEGTSPSPTASPQKKFAGEIKGAQQGQSPPPGQAAQVAEAEPEKEGEMSERQAKALLESMKNEEARVQLDERRPKRHVYKDW